MKTWKVEAAIIAVGMVLLGVIIKWVINDFIDKERIGISVRYGELPLRSIPYLTQTTV